MFSFSHHLVFASKASNPGKFATSKSCQIARRPNPININMANPASMSALREVAAAIRTLADTVQEPLLAATSALSQAEATLASLDVQEVTRQADPASVLALREVAAAVRTLADTVQEPLLAATSALSQAEATLSFLDVQEVTEALPADALPVPADALPMPADALPAVSSKSPVSDNSSRSPLPASMDQSATPSGLKRSAPSSLVTPSEVSSELPRSPKSPSGQTTGRRLSQALCARSSRF